MSRRLQGRSNVLSLLPTEIRNQLLSMKRPTPFFFSRKVWKVETNLRDLISDASFPT